MRIGKVRIIQTGGRWLVTYHSEVISGHDAKWKAMKAAKAHSWRIHTQNETADPRRANRRAGGQY